ncbi:DUF436 family protein, partial [Halobacillus sp. BBL2006]|uniref:DUF436 family protein n=1 Tax=Halobacillus sp. BBL2006 TaxID=1543706 RepID=UPI00054324CA
MTDVKAIQADVRSVVEQLLDSDTIREGFFVIGCSTSEIAGERIGTSGSEEIASVVFEELQQISQKTKAELA